MERKWQLMAENIGVRRKLRPTKRFWLLIMMLIVIPLITVAAMAWNADKPTNGSYIETAKNAVGILPDNRKINVLVLGINKRKNDPGRSNVTCLMTVDMSTKNVSLLWIPRDSRVNIPDNEWNKIGHAYAYGGAKLSEKTVANLLGVPIDYYLAVNMDGFKKVIDALGGVDINVDKRMHYFDPYDVGEVDNDGLIDLKPGQQHMDGNTALQYVRFRHDEMGDIGRIERQQKFAKALLADLVTPSVITKVPDALKEINSAIKTDMPLYELVGMAKVINDAYKQGLKTDMVPGKPVYINDISYWLPDIPAMRKQVAQIQGTSMDDKYLTDIRSLTDQYKISIAHSKVIDAP